MCLLLFAYRCHPEYPLLMLANRDEFHDRPNAPAAPWEGGELVAGRDLQAGGTWLGVAGGGRAAAVTNVREPGRAPPADTLSRGDIPRDFLRGQQPPWDCAAGLEAARYRGFNAVFFQLGAEPELVCAGNRHRAFAFSPGVHGISNGAPDAPWPKVLKGKAGTERLLAGIHGEVDEDNFVRPALALLRDSALAAVAELPSTGVDPALELALSSIFVQIDTRDSPSRGSYGTRASSLVAVDHRGRTQLWEQNYRDGEREGPLRHFRLD
ncbi:MULTISPECIES: NRDE family protein [unclassified Microbulbifer]|uniref:NRDE family protein n=1 Tax=unclassified Microbulbifer TaxID=2619833 RepID=UPI0027E530AE|nr:MULTISPECIES: NRDE family protein [unclassified Microbulbifer]